MSASASKRDRTSQDHADATEAFPRGKIARDSADGSTSFTPRRSKRLKVVDVSKGKGKGKGKRKQSGTGIDWLDASASDLTSTLAIKTARQLRLKDLTEGSKVWACVIAVTSARVTLALPFGLRGVIEYKAAKGRSREVKGAREPQNFEVGRLLRCVITKVDQEKKMVNLTTQLSALYGTSSLSAGHGLLRSGEVVPAFVESEEEHGWTLTFGTAKSKVVGFLPKASANEMVYEKSIIDVIITKAESKGRVVECSTDATLLSTQIAQDHKDIDLQNLIPGMLADAVVKSSISGGLVLNFMSYFTAIIDDTHLPKLTSKYKTGAKIQVRILYVDLERKVILVTALPHLISLDTNIMIRLPNMGRVIEEAEIVGIDDKQGLLFKVPYNDGTVDGFCHVSNASEKEIDKVSKAFQVGQEVRGRVIGYRPMENMVNLSLKPSVLEQQLFSYDDVYAGSTLNGKVVAVRDFGLVIELATGIRSVCPIIHMSDLTSTQPNWGKYKVNTRVKCLVIDCDPKKQRVTVSLKRSLVRSDLPHICSLDLSLLNVVSHGCVKGIESYGIFVQFCGGVTGMVHFSELGLSANETPSSCFDIGQVVKCKVIGVRKAQRQLNLSLHTLPRAIDSDFEIGTLGSICINQVLENELECTFVSVKGDEVDAVISVPHLSDSVSASKLLKEHLFPDAFLDNVMILKSGRNKKYFLTRKQSLLSIADKYVKSIADVKEGDIMYGYIEKIMPSRCVVKFLGNNIYGYIAKSQISESFVTDAANHLSLGQTVCCQVLGTDLEEGKMNLTLKHQVDNETCGQLLKSLLSDLEHIYTIRVNSENSKIKKWDDTLQIGSLIPCHVDSKKDYGIACHVVGKENVIGLVTPEHAVNSSEIGSEIQATILDIDKLGSYVDLSMKDNFSKSDAVAKLPKMTAKRQQIDAVVQLVKDNMLIVSIPSLGNVLALVGIISMNQQGIDPHDYFKHSQKIECNLCEKPDKDNGFRIILSSKPQSRKALHKKEKPKNDKTVGSWTNAVVESVEPLQISVRMKNNLKARLHITELVHDSGNDVNLDDYTFGKEVKVRVLGWGLGPNKRQRHFEVSCRTDTDLNLDKDILGNSLVPGKEVVGFIQEVKEDYLWVVFTRTIRGRLHVLESSKDFEELKRFQQRFHPGDRIRCTIKRSEIDSKNMDLTLLGAEVIESNPPACGDVKYGAVTKKSALHLQVQIGHRTYGSVYITDVLDSTMRENPFDGLKLGSIVKCLVLQTKVKQMTLALVGEVPSAQVPEEMDKASKYQIGQEVTGYVKSVTPKGCFVSLSRYIDARVKLKNLSNKFVVDPAQEFPRGKFVSGKVIDLNADSNQIELSLKTRETESKVSDLSEGDLLVGRITRIEKYGAFCYIEEKRLTGLIHVSEVHEEYVKSVTNLLSVGDIVNVAVLKVDVEKNRLYLSMKGLGKVENEEEEDEEEDDEGGMEEEEGGQEAMEEEEEEAIKDDFAYDADDGGVLNDDVDDDLERKRNLVQDMQIDAVAPINTDKNGVWSSFEEESQDQEGVEALHSQENGGKGIEHIPLKDTSNKRRERDVRAAEVARMNGDSEPASVSDFEKLVLVSPNDSYVWIRYMAFQLSLKEVEAARKVAERALEVINYREQEEKHNIWVAYLNLEFEHGNPPEESAMKLFQRGLPYNDGKKFHMALLSILQEKDKDDLAQQLLSTMCKKFRDYPDVWMSSIQYHLSKGREKVASAVLDKSLKSLPDREHVAMISQSALLHFKFNFHEQARHMFESILKSYSRRTDLWSVYIDQEVKLNNPQRVRNLFERIIHMDMSAKKMKFIFKKYMDYEMAHGDEASVDEVKQKAMAYVQSKM